MSAEASASRVRALSSAFRVQAQGCRSSGSPIYAHLLACAADDIDAGGPFARVLEGWEGRPVLDAVSLRLLGAVHREVLSGHAPELAAFYPTAGGSFEPGGTWRALRDFVAEGAAQLRPRLDEQLQTNEVRRCCSLLPGFLAVARRTDLPLRVLEIGASAGLNLNFDRYYYTLGPHTFGTQEAALALDCEWRGSAPDTGAPLRVAERAGCDLAPVDPTDPEQRLRLRSFVWPDHGERMERLHCALEVATTSPPAVERCGAGQWLRRVLSEPVPGCATVVYQSVVWWYLSEDERAQVTHTIEAAGARARPDAPCFWLRMEGADLEQAEIRLRGFPGEDQLLARTQWHGNWVEHLC